MKNSVLIIGLDGVPWDLLKPWIDEGKLPAFSKLLKKGSGGSLRTTIPPFSSSAWTSLFTGKNPGKHGIYEYTTDLGKLINSKSIKVAKIWQILSHYKKRCGDLSSRESKWVYGIWCFNPTKRENLFLSIETYVCIKKT